MKKVAMGLTVLSFVSMVGISGCTPGNNIPGSTAVGALTGGLAGGLLFHGEGQWAGVLGGAILGGIVGNHVGRNMDEQDRRNMQSAIVNTPVGQQASWTNSNTGSTYVVQPVKTYHRHNEYCREFQTKIKIGGEWKKGYGKACRKPDGSWKIVR